MLRLSNSVTCRKRYYNHTNQSVGVFISALQLCRKIKFRTYLHITLISKICYVVMVERSCGLKDNSLYLE